MTTPPSINPAGNAPPIASLAESVLAAAKAQVEAPAVNPAPEGTPTKPVSLAPEGDDAAGESTPEQAAPKGLSWNDAIKRVPPDVAALMKNMQADYTRKTQEVAEQRRDFLREREALLKGQKGLEDKELPEYDPFNEDSMKARIEHEVNRRLREAMAPMQQEYEAMAAEDSYNSFLGTHPDFKTDTALRSEVQHLLENNAALDLETAYWAAKGKQSRVVAAAEKENQAAQRKAAKAAALTGTAAPRRGSTGANPPKGELRRMTNADILAIAQARHSGN